MANTIISPNMNLPVPVVSVDPGPDWANNINACLSSIDGHNHTSGYGVAVPSAGININSNLPMNNYALSAVGSVVFQAQASLATLQAVYVSGVDLFYNDGNGNSVRITQSGSVAGATGTITGLPSGTASASYQSVGGTFQFQSATNTPANISGASILIAQQTTSPNFITIQSPNSLGSAYSLTLPTGLPGTSSFVVASTSGVLSYRTTTATAPTVQKFTSGSGTYTTPAGVLYIQIIMSGPGGGASGSGTTGGSSGLNGSASTTFGSNSCVTGGGGNLNAAGGGGGTATLSGSSGTAITGGSGNSQTTSPSGTAGYGVPGSGGANPMGGGGRTGSITAAGSAGTANTGAGGGGGSTQNVAAAYAGSGGGAGGYINAIIISPSATYAYAIGSGGGGGSAGTNGTTGGAGADGYIEVREFYQ